MKPVVINDEAAENPEAIRYYESKPPGIGLNFADKVSEAFQRIQRTDNLTERCDESFEELI